MKRISIGVIGGGQSATQEEMAAAEYLDIPLVTGLHAARNNLITLSSDVVIACPGGAGRPPSAPQESAPRAYPCSAHGKRLDRTAPVFL